MPDAGQRRALRHPRALSVRRNRTGPLRDGVGPIPDARAIHSPGRVCRPAILLSQNRQADTDRITAEHDYRVNQLALQHLIAWHRDAHGPDCPCVRQVGSAAEGLLTELSRDL